MQVQVTVHHFKEVKQELETEDTASNHEQREMNTC